MSRAPVPRTKALPAHWVAICGYPERPRFMADGAFAETEVEAMQKIEALLRAAFPSPPEIFSLIRGALIFVAAEDEGSV